jgi:Kef-type K+ transport system membrane component KefB
MEEAFRIAAIWLALAVVSTIIASHLRISMALVEICIGMAAAFFANQFFGPDALGASHDWLRFIASTGAVLLTFLAGAELDPAVMRAKLKEVTVVGLVGFFAPFLGCAALARFVLGWNGPASWLAGIALSTTEFPPAVEKFKTVGACTVPPAVTLETFECIAPKRCQDGTCWWNSASSCSCT